MSFTLGNVLLFFVEYEPADLGTDLALDALEQALYARRDTKGLVHLERPWVLGTFPYATRKSCAKQE